MREGLPGQMEPKAEDAFTVGLGRKEWGSGVGGPWVSSVGHWGWGEVQQTEQWEENFNVSVSFSWLLKQMRYRLGTLRHSALKQW